MQKNKKRKGFTLTELAIVIAVIAILIAVLVPTFTSLITSANESADQQAVKSMNTALATDEVLNGKPDNAVEAMAVLEENGFNVENYVALDSGNTIYYDLTYNRCLIWTTDSEGKSSVTYPSDLASTYESVTGVAANWFTFASIYNLTEDDIVSVDKDGNVTLSDGSSTTISGAIASAKAGETLIFELEEDAGTLSLYSVSISSGAYVTIDLNGNELDTTTYTTLSNGSTLYIKDGTMDTGTSCSGTNYVYNVQTGSSLTIENTEITSKGTVVYPQGDSAQVNIINTTITTSGVYCVSSNAATTANYNVAINIENSTLETSASDGDACPVMINVAGTLNISNSTIKGQRQGVIVRAGIANITNTTVSCTMESGNMNNNANEYMTDRTSFSTTKWADGNRVSLGAVVVGNNDKDGSYAADAILTMSGCDLSYSIGGSSYDEYEVALFAVANNTSKDGTIKYNTSVTVSGCTFSGKVINFDISSDNSVEKDSDNGCTCTLTGYTGYYTKWNGTAWE